ncbi:hypothetical protein AOC36_07195 [Erysipelothrix larvae]|uniref:GGDEF domain-containing protein n=1 Tax=Erysipelothrix larvae TaxID=1514105 RepID=A0A0X8H0D4_9FIRM|nr:diguanylate cyclase [Erysipelothrix larvae]AMC93775.1 hypothetical protein AOC36_07195 [Erysipelothrix larvae]
MINVQVYVVLVTLLLLLLTYQRNLHLTLNTQIDRIILGSITICILFAIFNTSVNLFFSAYALLTSLYITIPLSNVVLNHDHRIRQNYIYLWFYIFSLYILIPLIELTHLIYLNLAILIVFFVFGAMMIYRKFNHHTSIYSILFIVHSVSTLLFNIKVLLWVMFCEMLLAYVFHFSSLFRKEGKLISYLEKYKISMNDLVSGLTDNSIYSLIVMDKDLTMVYANQLVMTMTGYHRDEIIGSSYKMFRSEDTPGKIYDSLDEALNKGVEWKGIVENQKKDGSKYWEELFIAPIRKGNKTVGFISLKHDESYDFTQRVQLEFEANYDELTGVMRRRKFIETILDDEESANKDMSQYLIMIDLDRFKEINDQYGHDVGDKVLVIIAHFIRETFGHFGIVSRYGGDEFLIYVKGLSEMEIQEKLQMLKTEISNYTFEGILPAFNGEVTLSSGYAEMMYGYEETFKQADLRMYQNKNQAM